MQELLFLTQRIPYPPIKGEKIRPLRILRYLSERYCVHLGCFVDDPGDWQHEPDLRALSEECCFIPLSPAAAKLRCLRGLRSGAPLTLPYFWDQRLADWVKDILIRRRPAVIFVCSSCMAQYVDHTAFEQARLVLDFADVDSEKWKQYAASQTGAMRWVYARESQKLLEFERRVAAAFDASVFVARAEADLFRKLAPGSAGKVFHVDSGVDCEFFSPARHYEDPYGGIRNVVVFTGMMDYWPNIDAVCWFARDIFPLVLRQVPDARFYVVGANPARAVTDLRRLPGVTVTGRVADVRPYLAHAGGVVAPLRIARGIQNKVLEAMAMAKAVVATPHVLGGIDAEPERELLIAEDAEAFAETTANLLRSDNGAPIGMQARARVLERYQWAENLSPFDDIIAGGALARSEEA